MAKPDTADRPAVDTPPPVSPTFLVADLLVKFVEKQRAVLVQRCSGYAAREHASAKEAIAAADEFLAAAKTALTSLSDKD